MQGDQAILRGRATIAPWRVAFLCDVHDRSEVASAIRALGQAWGGTTMPIFDKNCSADELRNLAADFDVDSIYADPVPAHLAELLGQPGYKWTGRGEWGPFEFQPAYSKALLRTDCLVEAVDLTMVDTLAPDTLAASAVLSPADGGPLRFHLTESCGRYLTPYLSEGPYAEIGLFVVRDDAPEDVVAFWNLRAMGAQVWPLAVEMTAFDDILLETAAGAWSLLPAQTGIEKPPLLGWGFDAFDDDSRVRVDGVLRQAGVEVSVIPKDVAPLRSGFRGVRSELGVDFRVETERNAPVVHIPLPAIPLRRRSDFYPGAVRVCVEIHEASNFDPRLTAAVPPYRRMSTLLRFPFQSAVNDVRATVDGVAFEVQANESSVGYPLLSTVDVMRVLFNDDDVHVEQSDEGLFQSRASEMFDGPLSGAFTQPGLRAAVTEVARSATGVAFPHLERKILDSRGDWPDPLASRGTAPEEYARRLALQLTNSGYLVPTLRVRCPSCHVLASFDPDALSPTILCEFCRQRGSSPGKWCSGFLR